MGRDSDRGTPNRRLSPRSPAAAGHAVRAGEQAHGLNSSTSWTRPEYAGRKRPSSPSLRRSRPASAERSAAAPCGVRPQSVATAAGSAGASLMRAITPSSRAEWMAAAAAHASWKAAACAGVMGGSASLRTCSIGAADSVMRRPRPPLPSRRRSLSPRQGVPRWHQCSRRPPAIRTRARRSPRARADRPGRSRSHRAAGARC